MVAFWGKMLNRCFQTVVGNMCAAGVLCSTWLE